MSHCEGGLCNRSRARGLCCGGAGIVCPRNGGSERNGGTNCEAHCNCLLSGSSRGLGWIEVLKVGIGGSSSEKKAGVRLINKCGREAANVSTSLKRAGHELDLFSYWLAQLRSGATAVDTSRCFTLCDNWPHAGLFASSDDNYKQLIDPVIAACIQPALLDMCASAALALFVLAEALHPPRIPNLEATLVLRAYCARRTD